jgi:deoxyribodipyrimidine photolyase-related protein
MRLGLILGDQLSRKLPTLLHLAPESDRLVMAEVPQETRYVPHHQQKIALLFSAMRHFADELREAGWSLQYYPWGEHACLSLFDVVEMECRTHAITEVVISHCGEYRLLTEFQHSWAARLDIPVRILEDTRFLCTPAQFGHWAQGRKQLRMEYFYREMRRKTGLLMDGDQPVGGQWNFDHENRATYRGEPPIPALPTFERDAIDRQVLDLVAKEFSTHPGSLDSFAWATTRHSALQALTHFIDHRLPYFGDYQDAMVDGEDLLFHSALSPYLNCGLLDPLEVCRAAENAWRQGAVPLNAAEGFIRQIIGWREFVRGLYWLLMPDYAQRNTLNHQRGLPKYYWDGQTRMRCMSEALRNTLANGYAHHIQRLMITGNFALLTGILPEEICTWYLAMYVDAYDWVELPNTLGMVMHADGGVVGSKPYAASGNYIHKMSNHCRHCQYQVKTVTDPDSCPFNSLYWHFIERNREHFADNPRMAMIYRSLGKMSQEKRVAIMEHAERLLTHLDDL